MTTPAATASYYACTYHGRPDQVRRVRAEVAKHLAGYPAADDAILIVSEIASNAILHSNSKNEFFTIRIQAHPGYVWMECEDLGGEWHHKPDGDRPHGLDIIQALTGPDNWGVEITSSGHRVVWARLELPQEREALAEQQSRARGRPMRDHDVTALTVAELERARRELAASLALARPGSPVHAPILARISAIDAELAQRAAQMGQPYGRVW